jgi:hypothetical protein
MYMLMPFCWYTCLCSNLSNAAMGEEKKKRSAEDDSEVENEPIDDAGAMRMRKRKGLP